ncbi:ABC transporter permease subunit [Dactylosporangium sp. NPDC005572]|uniref:ABC transporter permease n=1 Tax=Dactylosporangium sp. NPDC005572 TaxID=3156889 RepID=UPI0033BE7132
MTTAATPVRARSFWGRARRCGPWLSVAPFLLIMLVGLILPTVALGFGAFGNGTSDVEAALGGGYRQALWGSLKLSVVCAVLGAVCGLLLARAVLAGGGLLRRLVLTASGVLANFGGVPLAFMFIATIGNAGIVTALIRDWTGFDLANSTFSLYQFGGLVLVYLYFLVPLMVIVIAPALDGVRAEWSEAAANLGATPGQYWRLVAGPLLAPPVMAGALLLFCGSLSAFATAQAMVGGTVPLVTLQIANALSGNVSADHEGVGAALALEMIVLVSIVMAVYWTIERRTARWLR